ncbi:unnamed protein product [Ectocarpus sp. 8 AP-2014]
MLLPSHVKFSLALGLDHYEGQSYIHSLLETSASTPDNSVGHHSLSPTNPASGGTSGFTHIHGHIKACTELFLRSYTLLPSLGSRSVPLTVWLSPGPCLSCRRPHRPVVGRATI